MFTKLPFFGGTFAAVLVCVPAHAEILVASWYGSRFEGRTTSAGCTFHADALSAASRVLPMGMMLRISRGGRSVVVQVIDRGPYVPNRQLDLSRATAVKLGMVRAGVATVTVEQLGVLPIRCR